MASGGATETSVREPSAAVGVRRSRQGHDRADQQSAMASSVRRSNGEAMADKEDVGGDGVLLGREGKQLASAADGCGCEQCLGFDRKSTLHKIDVNIFRFSVSDEFKFRC